jgi:hypothetical protein
LKSFYSTDPVSHTGKTNTWLTPLELIKSMGEFDLDPCAYPNHQTANKLIYEPMDGLTEEWEGRVWLNPPYGTQTDKWLKKLDRHGNGIALVFSRIETIWIQKYLSEHGFFAIKGRISFLKPDGSKSSNAGSGSILIPFGHLNRRIILNCGLPGIFFDPVKK